MRSVMVSIDDRLDSVSKQPYLELGGLVPWPRVDKTGKSKLSSVRWSKQPKQLPHSLVTSFTFSSRMDGTFRP